MYWLIKCLWKRTAASKRGYPNQWHNKDFRNRDTLFLRMRKGSWMDKFLAWASMSGTTYGDLVAVRNDRWHKVTACDGGNPHSKFVIHEMVHHMQCERRLTYGMQAIAYTLEWGWRWVAALFGKQTHARYDNKYEVEAWNKAGQDIRDWKADGLDPKRPWVI